MPELGQITKYLILY